MKTTVFAAAILGLAVAGAVPARAAGQPQLPAGTQEQGSAQQQMQTKRELDVNKYQQPLPQSPAAKQTEQGAQAAQTGVGPRGTKVAPSTTPGQANQPKTAETGVGERGTKVAPSTSPGQGAQEVQTH